MFADCCRGLKRDALLSRTKLLSFHVLRLIFGLGCLALNLWLQFMKPGATQQMYGEVRGSGKNLWTPLFIRSLEVFVLSLLSLYFE